jgi:hypothetical protein
MRYYYLLFYAIFGTIICVFFNLLVFCSRAVYLCVVCCFLACAFVCLLFLVVVCSVVLSVVYFM